ncbi:MAG: hypothetical protein ACFBSD_16300 [Paracoccaceae bacterium]
MRSPFARIGVEGSPGIGHNDGPPLDAGRSWRAFSWKQARAEALPRAPLEVVRRRVARARALGLTYPAYASILLGTGRDVVAFLFTAEAVGLAVRRGGWSLREDRAMRLRALERCQRLLIAPPPVEEIAPALRRAQNLVIEGVAPRPAEPASLPRARSAIRGVLDPLKLPSDAVVMVGTAPEERDWSEAGRLAKFLAAEAYFR